MNHTRELLLASASPRRCELLRQIGVAFRVTSHDVTEHRDAGELPMDYVKRMAREKAMSALSRVAADRRVAVLAADTIVVLGDEVLGKPRHRADGLRMLAALSGHRHQVITAVVVADRGRTEQAVSVSEVEFRHLTPAEIDRYWDTGEPQDKAGAYAIQGLAAVFVSFVSGSYSGVVGLPLYETALLLEKFAIPVWQPDSTTHGAEQ